MDLKSDDWIDLRPEGFELGNDLQLIDLRPDVSEFIPTERIQLKEEKVPIKEKVDDNRKSTRRKIPKKIMIIGTIFIVIILLLASFSVMFYINDNTIPKKDSDGDGILDYIEESEYGTNPNKKDTDGDDLNDKDEIEIYHTDPTNKDSDFDNLLDGKEINRYKTDPLNPDSDGDGTIDGDEIKNFDTDPLDNTDIQQQTGLLLYDPATKKNQENTRGNSDTWEAIFVTGLEDKNFNINVQEINLKDKPTVSYGEFILKNMDNTDNIWEIIQSNESNTIQMPEESLLTNNVDDYSFQRVNIDLPDSVSIIIEDHTIGFSIDQNLVYVILDSVPTFFTSVTLSGILIPESFYDYLDILVKVDISQEFSYLKKVVDKAKNMNSPISIILGETIEYKNTKILSGDVLYSISPNTIMEKNTNLFGLSYSNYEFLTKTISNADMEIVVMVEKTEPKNIWFLLTPIYVDSELNGIVTFDKVVETTKKNIENSLDIDLPDIDLKIPFNLKFGICTDKAPSSQDYKDVRVNGLWNLLSSSPTPVSVDSYFTWTTAENILETFATASGTNTEQIETLKMLNFANPGLSILIDREVTVEEVSNENITKYIAIAIGLKTETEDTALLQGNMNGVVYNLADIVNSNDMDIPFIIIDNYNLYDNIAETNLGNLNSNEENYITTTENELMISTEGYVIGTTLKTIAETAANVVPQLKIFQYLPFDIGLYDLSWFDNESLTIYHLPIVEIVHGKGETYLGEYMNVKGWFDECQTMEGFTNSMVNEIKEASKYLPTYLVNYLVEYLETGNSNNLYDFVFDFTSIGIIDYFQNYLDGFRGNVDGKFSSYLYGLRTELVNRIDELVTNLNAIANLMDSNIDDIDSLIENKLTDIISSASKLRDDIYDLRKKIADELDLFLDQFEEDHSFAGGVLKGFLEKWGSGTWRDYIDDLNNFKFLDLLEDDADNLVLSLNTLKSQLQNEIYDLRSNNIVDLRDNLGQLSDQIKTEFDNYKDNLTSELELWFDDFFNDNIPTDLIANLTHDFTSYFLEQYDFYKNLALALNVQSLDGYILVYEMAPKK